MARAQSAALAEAAGACLRRDWPVCEAMALSPAAICDYLAAYHADATYHPALIDVISPGGWAWVFAAIPSVSRSAATPARGRERRRTLMTALAAAPDAPR